MQQAYRHWRLETDADKCLWLHFDKQDSAANVLSADVLSELDAIIRAIEAVPPAALLICSDKANGFIAGADIQGFTTLKSAAEGEQLISDAQAIFNRLEALPIPTISVIHGFCLGGGLELALACRYRIALDDAKTKLGFPEVRLGLFPGFGGSLRSTRLLGAPTAMNMMLTGRNLSARAARKVGLVDVIAPQRLLMAVAAKMALAPPAPRTATFLQKLSNSFIARPLLASMMRKQVRKKARPEHYPAPFALIDHWRANGGQTQAMLQGEAKKVAELVLGDTAQNLIHVFFLMEALKSQGKASSCHAQHVHVIGAGVMGGDIAAWCALQGMRVSIEDQKPEYLSGMMKRAHQLFCKKLKKPHLVTQAMDRIIPDVKGAGLAHADVIIEAIFENVAAKHALYQRVEPIIKPDALLATNTSSIRLEVLSEVLQNPGRLVGLHFFNPVAMMQLVEIVIADNTDAKAAQQARDFTRRIDRLPLPVKSGPGFLVNRVLMPYLMEAVTLVEEGVQPLLIDQAAKQFGMPMGPIELADTVGLDICLHVGQILSQDMAISVPERLKTMVDKGLLGKKSGEGFYTYKNGKKTVEEAIGTLPEHVENRLMLRMINEAVACVRENVVESPELLDAGIIFGTGFAPFKGGPMHYIQAQSPAKMVETLAGLQSQFGERFGADAGWAELASEAMAADPHA